jgi:hypothetical protein
VIDHQGFQETSMQWVVPEDLESFPRIYGYIDPQDALPEVHERNNIGWVILGKSDQGGSTGSNEPEILQPGEHATVVYPNPFRESAWIGYELRNYSDVEIRIYDLQGQTVLVQHQSGMSPGAHTEPLDVESLRSGVYFYSIRTREFNETGKIIKMR